MLSYPGKCNKNHHDLGQLVLDALFVQVLGARTIPVSGDQYPFGMDDHKPYTSIVHSHHVWTPHMGTRQGDDGITQSPNLLNMFLPPIAP